MITNPIFAHIAMSKLVTWGPEAGALLARNSLQRRRAGCWVQMQNLPNAGHHPLSGLCPSQRAKMHALHILLPYCQHNTVSKAQQACIWRPQCFAAHFCCSRRLLLPLDSHTRSKSLPTLQWRQNPKQCLVYRPTRVAHLSSLSLAQMQWDGPMRTLLLLLLTTSAVCHWMSPSHPPKAMA
jgi:hypothetical protein